MDYFFYIISNVMLPIFLIIITGAIMNVRFKLDINTLSKLHFNLLVPVLLFVKIYESDVEKSIIGQVTIVTAGSIGVIYLIALIIAKFFKYTKSETSVFINSSSFFNGGNFSLPLIFLLFNSPQAVSIQAIVMLVQTILFFTIGVFVAGTGERGPKEAILYIMKMPLIYSIILAFLLRATGITIYSPIKESLDMLLNSFAALAIITLGAQLTQIKVNFSNAKVYISNILRLLVSPLVAYLWVMFLGIQGLTAQVLVIGLGAPTAVNVVIASIELDNEPEFASQAVFTSTLLASITLSLVIFLVFKFIPI